MRAFVIAFLVLLAGTTCIPWLPAQTELVQSRYFPADLEFVELRSIRSEKELDTPSALAELPEGAFFAEVRGQQTQHCRHGPVSVPSADLR